MKTRYLAGWAVALPLLMPIRCAACSCAWSGPLLKMAPASQLVIRARVLGYHGRSRGVDLAMDVEVQEVLKGNTRASRLRIWGDNGAQCRPYVSGFPVRTEWIFAIGKVTGGKDREGDYFIGGCGEYWARVENDHVVGRLTSPVPPSMADKPEQMSMKDLRERLRLARK